MERRCGNELHMYEETISCEVSRSYPDHPHSVQNANRMRRAI